MKLTILGSGTYKPLASRGPSGYWLEARGLNILLDCGSGTLQRLTKAGYDYQDIDVIVISHTHPDHTSDLAALFHIMFGSTKHLRRKPLTIIGGTGIKKWLKALFALYTPDNPSVLDKKRVSIFESTKQKTIKGVKFNFEKGDHSPSSIWIKVSHKEKSLVYTGDTGYSEKLIKFCHKIDLLTSECNNPEGKESSMHMMPSQVGTLASQAQVKKLIASHLSPEILKTNYKAVIKKHFKGPLIAAKDLMEIEF